MFLLYNPQRCKSKARAALTSLRNGVRFSTEIKHHPGTRRRLWISRVLRPAVHGRNNIRIRMRVRLQRLLPIAHRLFNLPEILQRRVRLERPPDSIPFLIENVSIHAPAQNRAQRRPKQTRAKHTEPSVTRTTRARMKPSRNTKQTSFRVSRSVPGPHFVHKRRRFKTRTHSDPHFVGSKRNKLKHDDANTTKQRTSIHALTMVFTTTRTYTTESRACACSTPSTSSSNRYRIRECGVAQWSQQSEDFAAMCVFCVRV